jgi:hypothetical protein
MREHEVYELLCVLIISLLYSHFFLNPRRMVLYKPRMQVDFVRKRRPRFRRSQPPSFRLTEGDVEIVRQLASHRFLRSTHIAALLDRSLDRTNDRLLRLFHAGYVDRPRAQLDYYATEGSEPMVYALADRGARLLIGCDGVDFANIDWSRKNRGAGQPFIEHHLEIVDFYVALKCSVRRRPDVRLIDAVEIVTSFPHPHISGRNPFELRAHVTHNGAAHKIGLVPDLVFGLEFVDRSRRCFMVEIDRGTMPVTRDNIGQTSVERKMRTYLSAQAAKQHERQFGWQAFRILMVTTDERRAQAMKRILRGIHIPFSLGPQLFLFATRHELYTGQPLASVWQDVDGRRLSLISGSV